MADAGTIRPTERLRRSFMYRVLEEAGANFTEINGAAVAASFGPVEAEIAAARVIAIADLSPLPRTGYKGHGALDWARKQGIAISDGNNIAHPQPGGELTVLTDDFYGVEEPEISCDGKKILFAGQKTATDHAQIGRRFWKKSVRWLTRV